MSRRRSKLSSVVLLAFVFGLETLSAQAGDLIGLTKGHAARLAYANAIERSVVNISIISRVGTNPQLADAIVKLGGRIRFRFDAAGFVIAALPIGRLSDVQALSWVEAIAVDAEPSWPASGYRSAVLMPSAETGRTPGSSDGDGGRPGDHAQSSAWPLLARPFPIDSPYPILRDIDAQSFRGQMPKSDGRGVVIAHVESAPDFLQPELQTAVGLDGRVVPKFLDVVRVATPVASLEESPDRSGRGWVRLSEPLESSGTRLSAGPNSYQIPEPGRYRIGKLALDATFLEWVRLAIPSDQEPSAGLPSRRHDLSLAVLRSEATGAVWIDTDDDGDFADEKGVGEFALSGEFGVIGRDDPKTAVRETIAFAIQSDVADGFLSVTFGTSVHASAVAGAAAANRGDEGRVDGVAPGAQLIAISRGYTTSSYGRGLVAAFSDPRADIVLLEAFSPATDSATSEQVKDGSSVLAMLTARLIHLYGKPCFFTAGNGAGMSTIGDISMAAGVISVSAYQSSASVLFNKGLVVDRADDLHFVGAHGPAGHGAIKPDLLAPANPLTLSAGFVPSGWKGPFQKLPPGYLVGSGTSIAAPVAAGAAALLMSAAKQTGLPHDGRAIRRAILNSARFLDGIPVYQQGHGLVQVAAAWRQLQRETAGPQPVEIIVAAPVRTATSHLLPTPHVGAGLFEREGWRPGETGERIITLTRNSGSRQPMSFDVRWVGDDGGTFVSAPTVTLPYGEAVPLPITISPGSPGAHSAIIHLDRRSAPAPAAKIGVMVVAAEEFNGANDFTIARTFKVRRPSGRISHFFRVPARADALSIEFEHGAESMALRLLSPANRLATGRLAIDPVWERGQATIPNPTPGVWEALFWENGGREFTLASSNRPLPPHDVRMRVALFGLDIGRADSSSASRRFGDSSAEAGFVVNNRLAPFRGSVVSSSLASLSSSRRSVRAGEQNVHDILVEEGSELLVVEITQVGAQYLDTDLHLFDCSQGGCVPARRSASFQMAERVLVQEPSPGLWKLIVDASTASGGTAEYEYRALFTHPRFGMTSVADPRVWRGTDQSWEVMARSWKVASPAAEATTTQIIYAINPALESLHFPIRHKPTFGNGIGLYRASRFEKDLVPLGLAIVETYDADVVMR